MRSRRETGFTLIELLVAMFLTVIVSMMVYTLYDVATGAFAATEAELRYLQAFRSITDKMEVELSSICFKVGYIPGPGESVSGWAPPVFKPINGGILPIRFEKQYIGFYCSVDGRTIDRVEYYYNPAEAKIYQDDGKDSDGDDPNVTWQTGGGFDPIDDNLPCLLIDDKGSFMLKRKLDCDPDDWTYDEFDADKNEHIYLQFGDYSQPFQPPDFSVRPPPEPDTGDILAEGIKDIRFWYLYSLREKKKFQVADHWPFDYDLLPTNGDRTTYTYGDKGLSYLCLPLAVQVDFTFETRGMERRLSKTIYFYSSLWNEFMSKAQ